MDTEKLTLSVNEAARLTGIGRDCLYRLTRRDDFPVLRLGRSIRIPRRALEAWIEREATRGTELEEGGGQ